jgi:hypothetical protein
MATPPAVVPEGQNATSGALQLASAGSVLARAGSQGEAPCPQQPTTNMSAGAKQANARKIENAVYGLRQGHNRKNLTYLLQCPGPTTFFAANRGSYPLGTTGMCSHTGVPHHIEMLGIQGFIEGQYIETTSGQPAVWSGLCGLGLNFLYIRTVEENQETGIYKSTREKAQFTTYSLLSGCGQDTTGGLEPTNNTPIGVEPNSLLLGTYSCDRLDLSYCCQPPVKLDSIKVHATSYTSHGPNLEQQQLTVSGITILTSGVFNTFETKNSSVVSLKGYNRIHQSVIYDSGITTDGIDLSTTIPTIDGSTLDNELHYHRKVPLTDFFVLSPDYPGRVIENVSGVLNNYTYRTSDDPGGPPPAFYLPTNVVTILSGDFGNEQYDVSNATISGVPVFQDEYPYYFSGIGTPGGPVETMNNGMGGTVGGGPQPSSNGSPRPRTTGDSVTVNDLKVGMCIEVKTLVVGGHPSETFTGKVTSIENDKASFTMTQVGDNHTSNKRIYNLNIDTMVLSGECDKNTNQTCPVNPEKDGCTADSVTDGDEVYVTFRENGIEQTFEGTIADKGSLAARSADPATEGTIVVNINGTPQTIWCGAQLATLNKDKTTSLLQSVKEGQELIVDVTLTDTGLTKFPGSGSKEFNLKIMSVNGATDKPESIVVRELGGRTATLNVSDIENGPDNPWTPVSIPSTPTTDPTHSKMLVSIKCKKDPRPGVGQSKIQPVGVGSEGQVALNSTLTLASAATEFDNSLYSTGQFIQDNLPITSDMNAIQFTATNIYKIDPGVMTYQTVMYQNGIIDFNYSGMPSFPQEDLPLVGMQNATKDIGITVSGVPHSNMTIRFTPSWRYGSYFTGQVTDSNGVTRNASTIIRSTRGATRLYVRKYLPIEFDKMNKIDYYYFRDRYSNMHMARLKIIDCVGNTFTLTDPINFLSTWTKCTVNSIPGTYIKGQSFELVFEFEWMSDVNVAQYLSDIKVTYDVKAR